MSEPRTATWKRRARSLGGKVIRKLGMLPGGMPDGLGDDAALLGQTLRQRVLVFFGDTRDSLYQIEQWYGPLRALDAQVGVVVVCMDSRTAAAVRASSGLEVLTVSQDSTLDDLLSRSNVALCLYVNHNPLNFVMLRFRSLVHVSMLHGDSDKSVSVSNQVKAYDFTFVAGQAGIDRFRDYTTLFDADARCLAVGRPQLDTDGATDPGAASERAPGSAEAVTVLYAPTWEGGQDSVAYGSTDTHGPAIVRSVLAAGHTVIYRPHPLAGVRVPAYGEADAVIRELIAAEVTAHPAAGHRVSTGGPIQGDFGQADLLIADVSAVANDWLPSGKPLVITTPAVGRARVAGTRLLDVVPRLSVDAAAGAGELVRLHAVEDPTREARGALVAYYFGDTTAGASIDRFLRTCAELIGRREVEWARVRANEDAGPRA